MGSLPESRECCVECRGRARDSTGGCWKRLRAVGRRPCRGWSARRSSSSAGPSIEWGDTTSFYAAAGEDQDFGRRLETPRAPLGGGSSFRVRHEPRDTETLLPVIRRNELRFLEQYGSRLDRLLWTLVHGTGGR